ncbi:hypothetical protein FI667_g8818, partial [Globisporangium splendens]
MATVQDNVVTCGHCSSRFSGNRDKFETTMSISLKERGKFEIGDEKQLATTSPANVALIQNLDVCMRCQKARSRKRDRGCFFFAELVEGGAGFVSEAAGVENGTDVEGKTSRRWRNEWLTSWHSRTAYRVLTAPDRREQVAPNESAQDKQGDPDEPTRAYRDFAEDFVTLVPSAHSAFRKCGCVGVRDSIAHVTFAGGKWREDTRTEQTETARNSVNGAGAEPFSTERWVRSSRSAGYISVDVQRELTERRTSETLEHTYLLTGSLVSDVKGYISGKATVDVTTPGGQRGGLSTRDPTFGAFPAARAGMTYDNEMGNDAQ